MVKLGNRVLALGLNSAPIEALNKAIKARVEPLSWGGHAKISINSSSFVVGNRRLG